MEKVTEIYCKLQGGNKKYEDNWAVRHIFFIKVMKTKNNCLIMSTKFISYVTLDNIATVKGFVFFYRPSYLIMKAVITINLHTSNKRKLCSLEINNKYLKLHFRM